MVIAEATYLAACARGDVLGVYYFSPGFYFSGELWGPLALFDGEGHARPALASLAAPPRR